MGAFFSAPAPAAPPPPPPPPPPSGIDDEAKLREDLVARNRRGRAGLIATSARGVLSQGSAAPQRKRLLGE